MIPNTNTSGSYLAPSLAEKPVFYTIDEVADILKCTRRHIQRLIASDKIRVIKLGNCSRIDGKTLAEDLERLTVSAASKSNK